VTRICDYEGSRYRTDFWEGQNREYEDLVERVAMRSLLPPAGGRLLEIGTGFGRLVDLYGGYRQVVLTDYARTQLEEARRYLGDDERFIFVVADVYQLPFVDSLFNALTMVRVMHHLAEVPAALAELHRVLVSEGTSVVEHASKLHLKALIRWLLRRQPWSPFDRSPVEFVELNFNFHPAWMRRQFIQAGFAVKNSRTVSHFRHDWLKRMAPTSWLVGLDRWAQQTGNWWQLTPSIFLQAQARKPAGKSPPGFFRCPVCGSADLSPLDLSSRQDAIIRCDGCGRSWSLKDGIYDFRTPL
jgi:ubiquinone/menaquinone biosynthesis C-methylase UbiE